MFIALLTQRFSIGKTEALDEAVFLTGGLPTFAPTTRARSRLHEEFTTCLLLSHLPFPSLPSKGDLGWRSIVESLVGVHRPGASFSAENKKKPHPLHQPSSFRPLPQRLVQFSDEHFGSVKQNWYSFLANILEGVAGNYSAENTRYSRVIEALRERPFMQ